MHAPRSSEGDEPEAHVDRGHGAGGQRREEREARDRGRREPPALPARLAPRARGREEEQRQREGDEEQRDPRRPLGPPAVGAEPQRQRGSGGQHREEEELDPGRERVEAQDRDREQRERREERPDLDPGCAEGGRREHRDHPAGREEEGRVVAGPRRAGVGPPPFREGEERRDEDRRAHGEFPGAPGLEPVREHPHQRHRRPADGRAERAGGRALLARHPARRDREQCAQERDRVEVVPDVRALREVQREGEGQEDRAGLRQEAGGRALASPLVARREEGEQQREDAQDDQGDREGRGPHPREDPERLEQERADEPERADERPAALVRHEEERDVEQEDVAEERDRLVAAGREQDRRREAAREAEPRDDLGTVAPGEEGAQARDEHHGRERHAEGEDPELERAPECCVEDHGRGARDRIPGERVAAPPDRLAAGQAREAGEGAQRDPHLLRDQAALDRVLEEEDPRDGQEHAAEDGRSAHAEPALPFDPRRAGTRRERRRRRGRRARERGDRGTAGAAGAAGTGGAGLGTATGSGARTGCGRSRDGGRVRSARTSSSSRAIRESALRPKATATAATAVSTTRNPPTIRTGKTSTRASGRQRAAVDHRTSGRGKQMSAHGPDRS
jgi:hypothetical protein